MQTVKLFWRLRGEIQSGTVEQVYLCPLPSWLVVAAGRVVAALIESALVAAGTYGIVRAFGPLHYHWSASALLPLVFVIITASPRRGAPGGWSGCWSPPPPTWPRGAWPSGSASRAPKPPPTPPPTAPPASPQPRPTR